MINNKQDFENEAIDKVHKHIKRTFNLGEYYINDVYWHDDNLGWGYTLTMAIKSKKYEDLVLLYDFHCELGKIKIFFVFENKVIDKEIGVIDENYNIIITGGY